MAVGAVADRTGERHDTHPAHHHPDRRRGRSGRLLTVGLAAAMLATTWSAVATPAATAGPKADNKGLRRFHPELRLPSEIKGRPLAKGVVRNKAGRAAADTVVTLEAWPSAEVLRTLSVGDQVPVTVVAKAITDSDRGFELKTDDPQVLSQYEDDGEVQFFTVAHGEDGEDAFAFTGTIADDGPTVTMADSDDAAPVALAVDEPAAVEDLIEIEAAQRASTCGWYYKSKRAQVPVTVARAYSDTTKAQTSFAYSAGQSSTVGVAVNVGGKLTQWSASGTSTVKTSVTVSYPTKVGKHKTGYKKYVTYGNYQQGCTAGTTYPANQKITYTTKWRAMAMEMGGSAVGALSSTPTANYCYQYVGGYYLDSSTATTFSGGVESGSLIGIGLSARSGYSSGIKLTMNLANGAKQYRVCGTTGNPEKAPGVVVAKD